ncbi:MAG: thiamine diphosphokinase [Bacillota bacterium]|nr:thiamine diphosphokinase [Bacillota bacterium]
MKRAIILASSPEINIEFCRQQIKADDFVICADGGLNVANKLNIRPDLVVGDFDSFKNELPQNIEIMKLNVKKDSTDTLVCADEAVKRGACEVIVLGGIGGRMDHTFANYSVLLFLANKGVKASLQDEKCEITVLNEGKYTFGGHCGKTVSLFPFGTESVNVSYKNLAYNLEKTDLIAEYPMGISNIIMDDKAEITIYKGTAILFMNREVV